MIGAARLLTAGLRSPPTARHPFTGSPEPIAGDIRAFQGAGARHLMLSFQRPALGETRSSEAVKPLVDA